MRFFALSKSKSPNVNASTKSDLFTLKNTLYSSLPPPSGLVSEHEQICRPKLRMSYQNVQEITNVNRDVWLKGRFDCTAAGVVYVITCQRCHKLYIGETGRRIVSGNTFVQWKASNRTPATREVGSPWSNTSIYLTTTKSMTCECLW